MKVSSRKQGAGTEEALVMQNHNLQLEADFEQESDENTFREDTSLNLL